MYQPVSTSSTTTAPKGSQYEIDNADDATSAWPDEALLVRDWHRSHACVDGADALRSGCVARFVPASNDPDQLLHVLDGGVSGPATPTGVARKLQLLSITPVANNGSAWVLLGELDKFVTVASARFKDLEIGDAGVSATVHGGVNESVSVVALQPNNNDEGWTVRSSVVQVGNSGHCRLHASHQGVFCT